MPRLYVYYLTGADSNSAPSSMGLSAAAAHKWGGLIAVGALFSGPVTIGRKERPCHIASQNTPVELKILGYCYRGD